MDDLGAAPFELTSTSSMIEGVALRSLSPSLDVRGSLCEIHRDDWDLAPRPVQWDFVSTRPRVLRGVHVHQMRSDYIIVVSGHATIGLADLRRHTASFRRTMVFDTVGDKPTVVIIPPGVAHGIYAHVQLDYLYGLTAQWEGRDGHLGCRYDDPTMGIAWPCSDCILLERDAHLPGFETLIRQFEEADGVRADMIGTSECPLPRY